MKKVLIVDDDKDFVTILALALTKKGYESKTAITSGDALWIFYSFQPDFIILDINIDQEDGREVCRMIKSAPTKIYIPVLLMSGNQELLGTFKAFGADGILKKPFGSDSLSSIAEQYCPI